LKNIIKTNLAQNSLFRLCQVLDYVNFQIMSNVGFCSGSDFVAVMSEFVLSRSFVIVKVLSIR